MKYLQRSTSMLSNDGKKMPLQESAKVKEKAPKKIDKEGIGSTSTCFWFKRVHGNGKNTWSKVNTSTRQDKLKIAMSTVFEVRNFSSFL